MADNKNHEIPEKGRAKDEEKKQSVGNRLGTAQTGGQNAGGDNRTDQDDQYTEDLRQSGRRKSRDDQ